MEKPKVKAITKYVKITLVFIGLILAFFMYKEIELAYHSDTINGVITSVVGQQKEDHRTRRHGYDNSFSYFIEYEFRLEKKVYKGSQNIYGRDFLRGFPIGLSKNSSILIVYSKTFPSLNEVYFE